MPRDVREDGRFIKEDGEIKKTRNDPHNPKNLLRRKRDPKGDGCDQISDGWTPTAWNETSTGKGDKPRPSSLPTEVYGYKFDLATGCITKKEFNKLMKEYNSR